MNTPLMSLSIQITLLAHHTHTHTHTYIHSAHKRTIEWFENQNMPFSIRYVILCSNKNIELIKLSTQGKCVFAAFHIGRFFWQEIFFCRQF